MANFKYIRNFLKIHAEGKIFVFKTIEDSNGLS